MNARIQFQIPRRTQNCALKGEHFQAGMEVFSLLYEETQGSFSRKDYCRRCWDEVLITDKIQQSDGYWKCTVPSSMPSKKAARSTRSEQALELLHSLLQNEESLNNKEEVFILSILLQHAKKLVLRKEIECKGKKYGVFEISQKEDYLTIEMIPLVSIDVDVVQKSLAQKLA